jgi:hypothetical protein
MTKRYLGSRSEKAIDYTARMYGTYSIYKTVKHNNRQYRHSSAPASSFIIHYPSLIYCPLSIVHCPLSIVHCPLSIVHCPLHQNSTMDAIRRQLDGIYQEIQDHKIEIKAPSTSAEMRTASIDAIKRVYDLAIIL